MTAIGRHVQLAIDDIQNGRLASALQHAAVAVDLTARSYGESRPSPGSALERLLADYSWLVELLAFGGMPLRGRTLPGLPIEGTAEPTFAEVLHHVVRRNALSEDVLSDRLAFADSDAFAVRNGRIVIPTKLVWALLAVVVFCPCNAGEKTADGYWLAMFQNHFVINDFWGQEAVARLVWVKRGAMRRG